MKEISSPTNKNGEIELIRRNAKGSIKMMPHKDRKS